MKIMIADDDPSMRYLLQAVLRKWHYEVVSAGDGNEAWQILQEKNSPMLVLLDWLMPGMSGVEICEKIRQSYRGRHMYILLLTAKDQKEDIVTGLKSGADDYVTKPIDFEILHARILVGARIIHLQMDLTHRIKQLKDALDSVKRLQGLLPICSYCKKVRDDQNYWHQVEVYVTQHTDAQFSHSICPDCKAKLMQDVDRRKKLSLTTMVRKG